MQVAYFVNSGSEANDLALRIAQCAAPGASHVAIMGGAYHGHTKAIIDLSPYKYEGPGGEGKKPYVHVLPCPDPYRCDACLPCCTWYLEAKFGPGLWRVPPATFCCQVSPDREPAQ